MTMRRASRSFIWPVAIALMGCAYTVAAPERVPQAVVGRDFLPPNYDGDLLGTLRRERPEWFESTGRGMTVLVDRIPVSLDTVVRLERDRINQVMYFDSAGAAAVFADAGGTTVVEVVTVLGASRAAGAWRLRPLPRVPLETRLGGAIALQHFDSLRSVGADAFFSGILPVGLGLTIGVHQTRQGYERTFRDGTPADPVFRLRYVFVEPRWYVGPNPSAAWRPYVGPRLLAAYWNGHFAHPADPAPPEDSGTEFGIGGVIGLTVVRTRHWVLDVGADYSRFDINFFLTTNNPIYRLDQPLRLDGPVFRWRTGLMYRW